MNAQPQLSYDFQLVDTIPYTPEQLKNLDNLVANDLDEHRLIRQVRKQIKVYKSLDFTVTISFTFKSKQPAWKLDIDTTSPITYETLSSIRDVLLGNIYSYDYDDALYVYQDPTYLT